MVVIFTCINEENPINDGARVLTTLIFQMLKGRQLHSQWSDLVEIFTLIQAFVHALVSCKNEEVPIKNKGTSRVVTAFLPL